MRFLLCSVIVAVAVSTTFASPYGDGFASGTPADYLENPPTDKVVLQPVTGMAGKACLQIAEKTAVTFKAVEVDPTVKYTLSFRASFQGGESIEENPRFDDLLLPGARKCAVPERSLIFLDAERKPIHVWPPMRNRMPFRQWREYHDTFYPPEQAALMCLTVSAAPGTTLALDDVRFEKAADEGAINVNPAFKQGIHDYSGWSSLAAGGKLFKLENGSTAFDTRYGSRGAFFPVSQPGTYSLTARAVGNGHYNFNIGLYLFDENGKQTGFFRTAGTSRPTHFLLPPGTVKGQFLVYSAILEELRLIRVGDENAIDSFHRQ